MSLTEVEKTIFLGISLINAINVHQKSLRNLKLIYYYTLNFSDYFGLKT